MGQSLKKCERNHLYDSTLSSCPYCPSSQKAGRVGTIEEVVDKHHRREPTIPENEHSGRLKTVPEDDVIQRDAKRKTVHSENADRSALDGKKIPRNKTVIVTGDSSTETGKAERVNPVAGWLVVVKGGQTGIDFRIRIGRNVIGRDLTCDIVLEDDKVSNTHSTVQFYSKTSEFIIFDERSQNGTFVNDQLITTNTQIKDGDRICLGDTEMIFRAFCNDQFKW